MIYKHIYRNKKAKVEKLRVQKKNGAKLEECMVLVYERNFNVKPNFLTVEDNIANVGE